jgi:hypothetical protein
MITRTATCRCGQLRATVTGDPVRVSVCHCLECQKRSGSAFAFQARWPDNQVTHFGEFREWSHTGDSGGTGVFCFCPTCGSTLSYVIDRLPGLTAIAVGAFAEPDCPEPEYSVYENRKHHWVGVHGDQIAHFD